MKKIIVIALAVMLAISMTVTAHAVTPTLKIPTVKIPDISGSVKVQISESFWDNWFKTHPIVFKAN